MERFYGDIIWWKKDSREVSVTYKHTGELIGFGDLGDAN